MIAADRLGQVRTGAATGVAAKHLARPGATSLGLIGAGWQASRSSPRSAPPCRRSSASSSRAARAERAEAFARGARRRGRRVAVRRRRLRRRRHRDDVEGPGAARRLAPRRRARLRDRRQRSAARELDAQVIARATLVCCDSLEDAKLESGDLIEPVAAGQLDWLEVHELHDIVAGEIPGRQSDADSCCSSRTGSRRGTSRSDTRCCGAPRRGRRGRSQSRHQPVSRRDGEPDASRMCELRGDRSPLLADPAAGRPRGDAAQEAGSGGGLSWNGISHVPGCRATSPRVNAVTLRRYDALEYGVAG